MSLQCILSVWKILFKLFKWLHNAYMVFIGIFLLLPTEKQALDAKTPESYDLLWAVSEPHDPIFFQHQLLVPGGILPACHPDFTS